MFQRLGFAEAELLVEFGYPTQRLVLRGENWKGDEVDDESEKMTENFDGRMPENFGMQAMEKCGGQRTGKPLARDFDIKTLVFFALSALNIVCPVINLIVGLGTMLATGGNAIIARKMGAGKKNVPRGILRLLFVRELF
jgi:hypothetical protein